MAVLSSVLIDFEDLRSLGFAMISSSYTGIGPSFANPVRTIKVTNLTDANLIISYDGINNKDVVGANSAFIYDYGSNKADAGGTLEQPVGKRVYVKQESIPPTSGNVYVTIMFATDVA